MVAPVSVEVTDKIQPGIKKKIQEIAVSARNAQTQIRGLQKQLNGLDTKKLSQLATAQSKVTNAQARQTQANARLRESNAKVAVSEQRKATEAQRTAKATTQAAQASERLKTQQARTQQALNKTSGSFKKVSNEAKAAQEEFNRLLGVSRQVPKGEASAIATRARQSLRDQEQTAKATAREQQRLEQSVVSLTQKYNPLQAEATQLQTDLQKLNRAYEQGVISQRDYAIQQSFIQQELRQTQAQQQELTRAIQKGATIDRSASRSRRQQAQRTQNVFFQLNDVVTGLVSGQRPLTVLTQQGFQLQQIYGVQDGFRGTIKGLVGDLGRLAKAFRGPLAITGVLAAGIASVNTEINKLEGVDVSFLDTLKATFTVLAQEVTKALGFKDALKDAKSLISDITSFITRRVSDVIKAIVFIADVTKRVFLAVSDLVSNAYNGLVNSVLTVIEALSRNVNSIINPIIDGINNIRDITPGIKGDVEKLNDVNLSGFKREVKPLGDIFDVTNALKEANENAESIKVLDRIAKAATQSSKSAGDAADNAKKLQDAISNLGKTAQRDFDKIGLSEVDSALLSIDNRVEDLVSQYGRLNAKQRETVQTAKELTKASIEQKQIQEIIKNTRTETEKNNKELSKLLDLREKAKTAEAVEAINRAIKEVGKSTNASAQIFENFATSIADNFTSTIRDMLDSSERSFSNFFDNIVNTFKDMLARLATLALVRPVIVPVIQQAGSALGVGSDALNSVGKQLGVGDIAGVANTASSLGGGLSKPIFSAGSTIGSSIDAIGLKLGIGSQVNPLTTSSKFIPVGTQGGLSTAFTPGSALGGVGGNFLANQLFGGDRGIGATLGGTAGSVAGTVAGTAAFGTALGSFAGPLGALAGSFVGNALGGLFGGGEPSDKSQAGVVNLAEGRLFNRTGLEGDKFSQKNFDAVTRFAEFSSELASIVGDTGQLTFKIGSRDGLRFTRRGQGRQRFNSPAAFLEGLTRNINQFGEDTSQSLSTALDNIEFSNLKDNAEQVISDIQFAANFDNLSSQLEAANDNTTQFERRIEQLNNEFDTARAQTERLGLSLQELEKNIATIERNIRKEFNDQVARDILSIVRPGSSDIVSEIERFQTQLREAEAINADIRQVEVLHQLRMQQLIQQTNQEQVGSLREQAQASDRLAKSYEQLADSLRETINELNVGPLSTLSPRQRLNEAQRQFNTTFRAAQGGDVEAAQRLPTLANRLLEQGQDFFASSTQFTLIQQDTISKLEQVESTALRRAEQERSILARTEEQIRSLSDSAKTIADTFEGGIGGLFTQQLAGARGATVGPDGRITSSRGTFAASNFNERIVAQFGEGLVSATSSVASKINSVFDRVVGDVTPGGGSRSRAFAQDASANERAFALAREFGIPGFATGGQFRGTALVGERGPEIITSSSNTNVIPFQQNKRVVEKIQENALRLEVLVGVTQEGFDRVVEALERLISVEEERGTDEATRVSGRSRAVA